MAEHAYIPMPQFRLSSTTNTSSLSSTEFQSSSGKITVLNQMTDGGDGNLFDDFGTIDYAGKTISAKLLDLDATATNYASDHQDQLAFENALSGQPSSSNNKGGTYGTSDVSEEVLGGSKVAVSYVTGSPTPTTHEMEFTPPAVTIDLCPTTTEYVVPGSVKFTWMGTAYVDAGGYVWRNRTGSDPGFMCGSINYSTGVVSMHSWVASGAASNFVLNSLWTQRMAWNTASVFGRTQSSPIKPTGFVMTITDIAGNELIGTAGLEGEIAGTGVRGQIEYESGTYEIQFGAYVLDSSLSAAEKAEWWYDADDVGAVEPLKIWKPRVVDPRFLTYNAVAYFYLPLDATILGLDPVRLPPDGKVPIYREGGFVVVGHRAATTPATVSNGNVINAGRVRLSRAKLFGDDGLEITDGYTLDLEAGTLTVVDITGWDQPVYLEHVVEDMAVVGDIQITGEITITRDLTHDYPADESYVSSAMVVPTLKARVNTVFDQATWNGTQWADAVNGAAAPGTFNNVSFPILVTNEGALTERWALHFTNGSTFNIVGEHVGIIGTGSINDTTAPINPITGAPYFTVPEGGWGIGWAPGNMLRFNTVGAMVPFWLIRTVQQGPETVEDHSFQVIVRGDVDTP